MWCTVQTYPITTSLQSRRWSARSGRAFCAGFAESNGVVLSSLSLRSRRLPRDAAFECVGRDAETCCTIFN